MTGAHLNPESGSSDTLRRLYHCPETRSMRVLWLLHELDLDFELIEMPFDLRNTRSPEYLAIHPLGRVPCLIDGSVKLFESGAIVQYLCEQYDRGSLGRPPGHSERPQWLQWIHYSETIAVHAAAIVQQKHFIERSQRSVATERLEATRLRKSIEAFDSVLEKHEYLLASGFSACDICVGYSVHLALRFVPITEYPHVEGYYLRLAYRPAFRRSLPANWSEPLMWLPHEDGAAS